MALITENPWVLGASGKAAKVLVYRKVGSRTILSAKPGKRESFTENQKKQNERFRNGTRFAKASLAAQETRAFYEEMRRKMSAAHGYPVTAYNAAMADFFVAPSIDKVDSSTYSGSKGNSILIEASDNGGVTKVSVAILNAQGAEVETGEAVKNGSDLLWAYTITQDNQNYAGGKIIVKAYDRPGNEAMTEVAL